MKKILYFPSEEYGSNHTSVEALFNKYLRRFFEIQIVYKDTKTRKIENNNLTINSKNKSNFFSEIKELIFTDFDFVIVRNDFDVLSDVINYKNKYNKNFLVGFQCTFLHSYRRIVQAHLEKKALIRKYLEYSFVKRKEEKLLKNCDFLIPNSKMMNKVVNKSNLPYTYIHSSIDLDLLPKKEVLKDLKIIKFVYIGTIDKLREIDLIFEAFEKINKDNWILDIYTKDIEIANKYKKEMKFNSDKVIINKALGRNELYERISHYDVGISLIPINDLYVVASPIKLSEYFACKLSVMSTAIPEAVDLYADKNCTFFVNFDLNSIVESINNILMKDKADLKLMGENGFNIVKEKRNYEIISCEIREFLENYNNK